MTDKQPSTNPYSALSVLELQEKIEQRRQVMTMLLDRLKPWLIEFGNWIFGGLIAFNLIMVAPIITIGLNHLDLMLSIVAFACALPLDVSGLLLLKLTKDMNDIAIDDVVTQAFKDANIPEIDDHLPTTEQIQTNYKRRTEIGLRYSLRLGTASAILTFLGMIAALWYIAWWVATIFVIVALLSCFITMNVATRIWRPDSDSKHRASRNPSQNP